MADTDKQKFEFVSGASYTCTVSKSPGYKKGNEYRAYKNEKGLVCLRGSDGFEDLCSMLVSGFKTA
jgi:hypothetical protein